MQIRTKTPFDIRNLHRSYLVGLRRRLSRTRKPSFLMLSTGLSQDTKVDRIPSCVDTRLPHRYIGGAQQRFQLHRSTVKSAPDPSAIYDRYGFTSAKFPAKRRPQDAPWPVVYAPRPGVDAWDNVATASLPRRRVAPPAFD